MGEPGAPFGRSVRDHLPRVLSPTGGLRLYCELNLTNVSDLTLFSLVWIFYSLEWFSISSCTSRVFIGFWAPLQGLPVRAAQILRTVSMFVFSINTDGLLHVVHGQVSRAWIIQRQSDWNEYESTGRVRCRLSGRERERETKRMNNSNADILNHMSNELLTCWLG